MVDAHLTIIAAVAAAGTAVAIVVHATAILAIAFAVNAAAPVPPTESSVSPLFADPRAIATVVAATAVATDSPNTHTPSPRKEKGLTAKSDGDVHER